MGRGVGRPGDHAVGHIQMNHHGAEVTDITHGVKCGVHGDPLVSAQFKKGPGKFFTQG